MWKRLQSKIKSLDVKDYIQILVIFWVMVVTIIMILFSVAIPAHGHYLHFDDFAKDNNSTITQGWSPGYGLVVAADDNDDGKPDAFWLLYKDGDFLHSKIHIQYLTETEAKALLYKRKF